MSEPYLILHKVRGQPAFDIAERITIGDEEGWIIPTSGHRAYPHQCWNLLNLAIISADYDPLTTHADASLPEDWPDHYPTNSAPAPARAEGLLAALGLKAEPAQIKRRKL